MHIHFRDRNPEMVAALTREFGSILKFPPHCCDIFDGPLTDCIVSPANSYGFFDGGIDYVYAQRWPWIQDYVQKTGVAGSKRFIPIGDEIFVSIHEQPDYGGVIVAPTMRIPESIRGTTNVYLAFLAALRVKLMHPQMRSMTCPGFGTGVGEMDPKIAAFQMRMAYRHTFEQPFDPGKDTLRAITLEHALRTGDRELASGL